MEGNPALRRATQVVIDASVALKWFVRVEENTERVLTLRRAHVEGKISLLAPMLIPYEVGNVLRHNHSLPENKRYQACSQLDGSFNEYSWEQPSNFHVDC